MGDKGGFIWLASYPKSGNTYLRLLLEAYWRNGALDINDIRSSNGDAGAPLIHAVSPLSCEELGFRGEALVRPTALLHYYSRFSDPKPLVKTHWVNVQPPGLPPFIPKDLTHSAIYVIRDPRDVFVSCMNYYKYPPSLMADALNSKEFTIGGDGKYARAMVSSWSNHVASWVGEQDFPVHIMSYEDMLDDPVKELTEVLTFLGRDVDEERVKIAAEAAQLSRVRKQEEEKGFSEHQGRNEKFFGEGGKRWQNELGQRWIDRIEEDHGKIMRLIGFLPEEGQEAEVSDDADDSDNVVALAGER
jgi:hypothetical protein